MTKTLQLELADAVYAALTRLAQSGEQTAEQLVVEWITSAANNIAAIQLRTPQRRPRRSTAGASQPAKMANDRANTSSRPNETRAAWIYELQITLLESQPAIWRRLQLPGGVTLIKLHHALQVLMGWQNYHLHQLTVNGAIYGMRVDDWQDATPDLLDERGVRLYRIAPTSGTRLIYAYDFGDDWQLELIVKRIKPAQAGAAQLVCLDGQRAAPPEDVGGIGGFEEFVQAIRHPKHPEHRSWLEWGGGSFDPEKFDVEAANRALKKLR